MNHLKEERGGSNRAAGPPGPAGPTDQGEDPLAFRLGPPSARSSWTFPTGQDVPQARQTGESTPRQPGVRASVSSGFHDRILQHKS